MKRRAAADLVTACLEGDRSAFAELVERYQLQVFNAAYRIAGNREDAEDATQATFVKAYERLEQFDPSYRFFSWIYRIGINETLNLVGKRHRSADLETEPAAAAADPERTTRSREAGAALQAALLELSPPLRVVIVLRHFRELSYGEIAEVVEVPVKTVKSRLFSARRALRKTLRAHRPR